MSFPEHTEEEFNNFLYKATQVESIVKKLASNDQNLQAIGDAEAKAFLGETQGNTILETTEEQNLKIKLKHDKTILNYKALHKKEDPTGATQSQEAFMAEVERDADRRYKDRLVRMERMETLKKQATKAFRRGDYESAICLYTKALEQIKDSVLLYNNRALTYMKLELWEKAVPDLETALRLNEDCLRSWMLLMKIYKIQGNVKEFNRCLQEAQERNPDSLNIIQGYVQELDSI